MKASQPKLPLEIEADWRLDERTKAIGLAGVARARAVLARLDESEERRSNAA
ncbi:MAG: hypothetical protein ABJD24_14110 [Acidimicrobiales bacterium]